LGAARSPGIAWGKDLEMHDDLEFNKSPRENLDTWGGVKKLILYSSIFVVIVLVLMAATLTP